VCGKPIIEWLQEAIEAIGQDPVIVKLKLPSSMLKITQAKAALELFATSVSDWEFPPNWVEERSEYSKKMSHFQEACSDALRHKQAITNTMRDADQAGIKAKQFWRTQRTKIRKHMQEAHRKIPKPVAKTFADFMYSTAAPPQPLGINLGYSSPMCEITASTDSAAFKTPWMIKYDADEEADTMGYYQKAFHNFFKKHEKQVCSKKYECMKIMVAPSSALSSTVAAIDVLADDAIDFNHPGMGTNWFTFPKDLRMAIWTSFTECLNICDQGMPFARLPCFATLFTGQAVCIVLNGNTVMENPNLASWLSSSDSLDLSDQCSWLMNEGDTVWVPCGCVPIFIGNSPDQKYTVDMKMKEPPKSGAIQRHTFAVGFTPLFDADFCQATCGGNLCQHVAAQYVRSFPYLPSTWKNHSDVKAWKAKMEAVPVAAASAAGKTGDDV